MKDTDTKGKDKFKHFGVCLVLAFLCPLAAIVAAVSKEIHDRKTGGHFCWWDILADALGVIVGTTFHAVIIWRV